MKTIKDKNIVLRPVRLSDAKLFFECEQDREARKNLMSTPKNIAEVRSDLRKTIKEMGKKKSNNDGFAIEWKGQTVGKISIEGMNEKHGEHKASISYMIHKDYRGKGIGTRAIKLITAYGSKKYKLKRIWTFTRTFNKASARALEKAGYKLEGILRKNKFKDGKYLDDMLWAKVK